MASDIVGSHPILSHHTTLQCRIGNDEKKEHQIHSKYSTHADFCIRILQCHRDPIIKQITHTLIMSDGIPSLATLQNIDSLTIVLSTLFEPSPPLHTLLVPSVLERLSSSSLPQSYNQLIDICANVAEGWSWEQKGEFLSGHPMIGEVKGLSKLSGKEQSGGGETSKEVLERSVRGACF